MAKIKFKHNYNAEDFPSRAEYNNKDVLTQPDMAMSVQEMLDRHKRGLPVEAGKVPIYNGEEELPDLSKMDLTERQAYVEAVADRLADIKEKLKAVEALKKEKAEAARIEAEVQKRLKELPPVQPKKEGDNA